MARKQTREELLAKIASLETQALVANWMLRAARAYAPETFVVVTSPRGLSTFIVQTDEHGAPAAIWSELTGNQASELLRACGDDGPRYDACAAAIAALRRAAGIQTERAAEV